MFRSSRVQFVSKTRRSRRWSSIVNYTLRFAPGLDFIGVSSNNGDVEKRSLPLQFSLDRAISILSTYTDPIALQQIQEWPYTWETNAEQAEKKEDLC